MGPAISIARPLDEVMRTARTPLLLEPHALERRGKLRRDVGGFFGRQPIVEFLKHREHQRFGLAMLAAETSRDIADERRPSRIRYEHRVCRWIRLRRRSRSHRSYPESERRG